MNNPLPARSASSGRRPRSGRRPPRRTRSIRRTADTLRVSAGACAPGWYFVLLAAPAFAQPAEFADPAAPFVAVVLDDSGSMDEPMPGSRETKMAVAKGALAEVIGGLPPTARVGLFTLNATWTRAPDDGGEGRETGHEAFGIGEAGPGEAAAVLDQVVAAGSTPLGERLAEAAAALAEARAANKYGTYRLLIVTDGEATDADALAAALPRALGAGLTVDVIGVAMRADHSLATRVDSYRRADDPAGLSAALADVLAETGGAADDGTGTDYDLIAPLPEPLAAAALSALADDAPPDFAAPAGDDFAPPPGRFPDRPPPFGAPADDGDAFNPLGGLCCCLGVLVLLGAVGLNVLGRALGGGGPRRRRRR